MDPVKGKTRKQKNNAVFNLSCCGNLSRQHVLRIYFWIKANLLPTSVVAGERGCSVGTSKQSSDADSVKYWLEGTQEPLL